MLMAQTQYVLIGRLVMPATAFLLLIIIGRHSDQLLGEYALVTTFYYVMQTLPLLGLAPFVMREVARQPQAAGAYFVTIGLLSLTVCVAVNGVARLALFATPYSSAVEYGVHIVGYSIFGGIFAFLGEIILISLGRARAVAITTVLENVLRLLVSIVVLMRDGDVVQLMWVVFATRMMALLVYAVLLRRVAPLPFWPDWSILRSARAVLPVFAASAVLLLVMTRMDFFVLSFYTEAAELGYYAIAYRLFEIFMLGVTAVGTAVFPLMARQYVDDQAGLLDNCRLLMLGMLTLLVPVAIAAHVGSDLYVRWLFSEQYPEAVYLAGLIVLLLPLAGLDALCSAMLNASDRQARDLRAMLVGGAVYGVGLLLLVPEMLGFGAFIAMAIATTVQAGLRLADIRRRFGALVSGGDLVGHALVALGTLWVVDQMLDDSVGLLDIFSMGSLLLLGYPAILILLGLFRPLRLLARVWPSHELRPSHTVAGLVDRLVIDERRRRAWLSEGGRTPPRYENWGLACVVLYRVSRFLTERGWRGCGRLVGQLNLCLTKTDIAPESEIGPGLVVVRPATFIVSGKVGARAVFDAWSGIGLRGSDDVGAGPGVPIVLDDVSFGIRAGVLGGVRVPSGTSVPAGRGIFRAIDLRAPKRKPEVES